MCRVSESCAATPAPPLPALCIPPSPLSIAAVAGVGERRRSQNWVPRAAALSALFPSSPRPPPARKKEALALRRPGFDPGFLPRLPRSHRTKQTRIGRVADCHCRTDATPRRDPGTGARGRAFCAVHNSNFLGSMKGDKGGWRERWRRWESDARAAPLPQSPPHKTPSHTIGPSLGRHMAENPGERGAGKGWARVYSARGTRALSFMALSSLSRYRAGCGHGGTCSSGSGWCRWQREHVVAASTLPPFL